MQWKRTTRMRKVVIIFSVCIILLLSFSIRTIVKRKYIARSYNAELNNILFNVTSERIACLQPKLELYPNQEFLKAFEDIPMPICGETDWISTNSGTVHFSRIALENYGHFDCTYEPLIRLNEFATYKKSEKFILKDGDRVSSDFFHAECWTSSGSVYSNDHATVVPLSNIHGELGPNALDLNVLIFGFDSVSNLAWQRKLPKTYRYLLDELNAVVLQGYNIVAVKTLGALLPILTGRTEQELNTKFVDGFPFIWNDLRKTGYVTQYSEDRYDFSTFNYKFKGFDKQPTDHYMRTFYVEIERWYKWMDSYCLGSRLRHNLMFDYVRDFYQAYPNIRKFSFSLLNQFSHDDNSPLNIVDDDFRNFLKSMNDHGFFNKTLLMVMSDHGVGYDSIRNTAQGNYEERNPFFSIRVPPWFKAKYPEHYANLEVNAQRLTTPFDIHETLRSVLDFRPPKTGNLAKRGISLFSEVPKERTCENAAIEPHWCACLHRQPMNVKNVLILHFADAFIDHLNKILPMELCYQLRVDKIFSAYRIIDNSLFRPYFVEDEKKNEYYLIKLQTAPGEGLFEFTVRFSTADNRTHVNEQTCSRINKYGNSPACVKKIYPKMLPYCVCKHGFVARSGV